MRPSLLAGGYYYFFLFFLLPLNKQKRRLEWLQVYICIYTHGKGGMDDRHPTGVCLIPTITLRAICIKHALSLQGFNTQLLFSPLRPSRFRFIP